MAPVDPMTTDNTFQKENGDTALREHAVSKRKPRAVVTKQKAKPAKKPMKKRKLGKHKS